MDLRQEKLDAMRLDELHESHMRRDLDYFIEESTFKDAVAILAVLKQECHMYDQDFQHIITLLQDDMPEPLKEN